MSFAGAAKLWMSNAPVKRPPRSATPVTGTITPTLPFEGCAGRLED